jgi:hypothetical protein
VLQILKKKNFYLGVGAHAAPKSSAKRAVASALPSDCSQNANLAPQRFEATSAPANAKRTPEGVLFALCVMTLIDDIVFVITKNTQLTEKCPKPFLPY